VIETYVMVPGQNGDRLKQRQHQIGIRKRR